MKQINYQMLLTLQRAPHYTAYRTLFFTYYSAAIRCALVITPRCAEPKVNSNAQLSTTQLRI